jgi:hypothetical protein
MAVFLERARRQVAPQARCLCYGRRHTKMPDSYSPSGISIPAIKQKLNCALLVSSSLSLDFFRYRDLNRMG